VRVLLAGLLLALAAPVGAQESRLLVVTGLGGEAQYSDAFHEWAIAMMDAAEKTYGVPASNITYLAEKPERDPARIKGPSTKVGIEKAIEEIAGRLQPQDAVLVLLIGHGSSQSGDCRLNLPGPDLGGAELARLLDRLGPARVAVVNAFSASGDLAKTLAGKGRIVVTATKSGMERNETVFGRYFVEATMLGARWPASTKRRTGCSPNTRCWRTAATAWAVPPPSRPAGTERVRGRGSSAVRRGTGAVPPIRSSPPCRRSATSSSSGSKG
jgi:hypothetical protein